MNSNRVGSLSWPRVDGVLNSKNVGSEATFQEGHDGQEEMLWHGTHRIMPQLHFLESGHSILSQTAFSDGSPGLYVSDSVADFSAFSCSQPSDGQSRGWSP